MGLVLQLEVDDERLDLEAEEVESCVVVQLKLDLEVLERLDMEVLAGLDEGRKFQQ